MYNALRFCCLLL